ncbi:hypothetical protein BU16DRAFT_532477 [Lophium mytilinum]|uniref:Lysine-specific metallo-endopeptidase domain-containing protein n=1 Tax=Lophium mytilinum TaxID=390894 RepID=A0A6A6REB5_9PEZI|nr:hypothetical protein BU16DRAFT_532477 [Lophium mytilinum]
MRSLAILVSISIAQVKAFMIDTASCKGNDLQFVRDAVNTAFEMSAKAAEQTSSDKRAQGLDPDDVNVMTAIFNPFEMDQNAGYLYKAFNGINGMATEFFNDDDLKAANGAEGKEVRRRRYTAIPTISRSATMANGTTPVVYSAAPDNPPPLKEDPHKVCAQDFGANIKPDAFMFTTTTEHALYDQVTICPWFLDYYNSKSFRQMRDLGHGKSAMWVKVSRAIKLDKWVAKIKYTPIDNVGLFDKVMLHEFMHTKAGGKQIDVNEWGGYGRNNSSLPPLPVANGLRMEKLSRAW